MDKDKIFNLYSSKPLKQIASYDSSHGEDDFRMVYIVEFPNGNKLALKVTKNSFTTPERVKGWAELIGHYNNLGIYCPGIVRNRNGEYCERTDGYLVFAEEYMKYKPAAGRDESLTGAQKYVEKLYESIGLAAANPAPLVPWNTAYCLYDKFNEAEKYDENYECALTICDYYRDNIPEYAMRARKIFEEYCRRRERFEPVYRTLPKAVFQGDINESNILLTPSGDFKGMIDFNLSGTEVRKRF